MQYSIAALLALATAAVAIPQGVTSAIAPQASAPSGCQTSYPGSFEIEVVNVTSSSSKRNLQKRDDPLIMTLANGILKDEKGRTGYIAANYQFQFDGPPQTGAIYTAGWSVCGNGSMALGGSAMFWSCLSGTFYNLYDQSTGAQCVPVYIVTLSDSDSAASQLGDGQPTASPVASQISDGQPTASVLKSTSAAPVTQISDGQVQASTSASKVAPVTQISDGQVQASTKASTMVVSTAAPVTQISDGQVQAPTSKPKPVTQISDGQIQAPTGANNTFASPTQSIVPYTGAAILPTARGELLGLAAGVLGLAALL